ncbi:MAG: hypothetical protein AB1389_10705 [Campylobacterota bacterium]
MIIPKRDAKSYGAVHIDYFLTFVGFCKKVYSDEVQSIDVLIDGNKIDTIVCDKTIDKVSQIYDIEGHGFEYDLPEVYFDKRHLLSFRCSDSGEELVNSPISTICKNDEKFNEYKFMHSLLQVNLDKIRDIYCPNSIGFIATAEVINNKEFVNYIYELNTNLPTVNLKGFCFSQDEITLLANKFTFVEGILVSTVYDLKSNIEFFIWNKINKGLSDEIASRLFCETTYHIRFSPELKSKSIKDFDKTDITMNLIKNNLEYFGFNSIDYESSSNNCIVMLNNYAKKYVSKLIWKDITTNDEAFYFYNIVLPSYLLSSADYKIYFYKFILRIKDKVVSI